MKSSYDSVMAQLEHPFAGPMFTHNRTSKIEGEALAKAKGLTKYEIRDGVFLYAKNEKEAIKNASSITLLLDVGGGNTRETEITLSPSKILSHDIALAVQSHYNRLSKTKL